MFQRLEKNENETVEEMIAKVVGKVGPSMLLTSLSESLAFFLGRHPNSKLFSLEIISMSKLFQSLNYKYELILIVFSRNKLIFNYLQVL